MLIQYFIASPFIFLNFSSLYLIIKLQNQMLIIKMSFDRKWRKRRNDTICLTICCLFGIVKSGSAYVFSKSAIEVSKITSKRIYLFAEKTYQRYDYN